MSIQKYRFDYQGEAYANGAIPVYADWQFGPTLAGLRNTPCETYGRRTVYITGEADSFFSQPAAIRVRGKTVKGFVTGDDMGLSFVANANANAKG